MRSAAATFTLTVPSYPNSPAGPAGGVLFFRRSRVSIRVLKSSGGVMLLLNTLPLWVSAPMVVAMTLIAASVPSLIRRRIHLDRLRVNNEVAGFKFATVGVLYAVLLAFAVIVVWEKFAEVERIVSKEAGAVATLYRVSEGLDEQPGDAFRQNLVDYTKAAINDDWPAMEQGKYSRHVTEALNRAYSTIISLHPTDQRGAAILTELLRQLDLVTQARRDRIVSARGAIPGVLWFVLVSGAFLTIGFTFFFGTQNALVQGLMTGILSFLIFSAMAVIVAIDHPFAGPVKVHPDALQAVEEDFVRQPAS
jgi:hypothetical protein